MSELSVGSLSGLAANSYVIDVASGSSLDLSNGAVLPAGSIIQVVSTTKTDTFSTTSTSYVDVPGLSATITPRSTSSKIIVLVGFAYGSDGTTVGMRFRLVRDSTAIAIADSGDSTLNLNTNSASGRDSAQVNFLDSPATTSSTTYKIEMKVTSLTGYVNRGVNDLRSIASITLMEVAG